MVAWYWLPVLFGAGIVAGAWLIALLVAGGDRDGRH